MKVVHVNNIDLHGQRFNGHDLHQVLIERGIDSKNLVFDKFGTLNTTIEFGSNIKKHFVRQIISELEDKLSVQSLYYPFARDIERLPDYQDADIVHLHLIHNKFMSLLDLPRMAKKKKVVLTTHDPWFTTGHCIYSLGCEKWRIGCEDCPKLDLDFKMVEDNSSEMWQIKKKIFEQTELDIVVASRYMEKIIKESPITSQINRIHYIPFGIDLNVFKERGDRNAIREKLGIESDDIVLLFRAINTPFKGVPNIIEALKLLKKESNRYKNIVVLTCNDTGLVTDLERDYRCIEHGWVYNEEQMVELYSIADIFLMPSRAEAFGLMAIEAMACSKPVISFKETSLEEVTFSPNCGISVEMGSSEALKDAILHLVLNENERKERGILSRNIAEENYDINYYHQRMIDMYKEIYSR